MRPEADQLGELLARREFVPGRSSVLFAFFARWLNDDAGHAGRGGVGAGDDPDATEGRIRHLDMRQIYGPGDDTAKAIRAYDGGRLVTEKSGQNGFAPGLAQGDATIGHAALNTLFVLEHNRVCDLIREEVKKTEKGAGAAGLDEAVFRTARRILVALELKIVVEEYIDHLTASSEKSRKFLFDQSFAEVRKSRWQSPSPAQSNIPRWWHCLIPDRFEMAGECQDDFSLPADSGLMPGHGFEAVLVSASRQAAGKFSLGNTPAFCLDADIADVINSRNACPGSINALREGFGLSKLKNLACLCQSSEEARWLEDIYGADIRNLDVHIGLYAEKRDDPDRDVFGELMTRMIAYDAFKLALNNPLLSGNLWGAWTFTETGMDLIEKTHCLDDVLLRNSNRGDGGPRISMRAPSPGS